LRLTAAFLNDNALVLLILGSVRSKMSRLDLFISRLAKYSQIIPPGSNNYTS